MRASPAEYNSALHSTRRFGATGLAAGGAHGVEEFVVAFGFFQAVYEEFGGFGVVHGVQEFAQYPHFLAFFLIREQVFAACAGTADVDGGEDSFLSDAPLEVNFHVASAFEFFVNEVVHFRAGVDEGGGDYGQAAALLDVARGAKETLGTLHGIGVDAASEYFARCRHDVVVSARQAGYGIEQYDYVAFVLDQALGFFDDHFADLHVAILRFVKGAGYDFTAHGALHFSYFFRALVDEQDDDYGVGVGARYAVRHALQHQGFASFGRRYDQSALTKADGRRQVDNPGGEFVFATVAMAELDAPIGKERGQVFKDGAAATGFGDVFVDGVDLQQREITLALLGLAHAAFDRVACAQIEFTHLRRRDVDIVGAS